MDIRYTEGARALLVPGVGRVERGETVTVPDEQGRRLIKRQGWQEVKPPAPSSPKPTTATKPKKED